MSLALLVPAFLVGLGLLAIPIVVHLRQRERRDPIRFPSLMFLARLPHRTSERRRLTHRLLLAMRALAVALLVMAFARPFLERDADRQLAARSGRAVFLLVDRSMSMGYRGVWERAIDSMDAVLREIGPADRIALIGFDETAEVLVPLGADVAGVRAALARLHPTGRSTRFPPAIRLANELATGARGLAAQFVLVTDLQRHATVGLESVDRLPGTLLRVASVSPASPLNARVVDAEVDQLAEGGRARLTVAARIATKADTGWTTTAHLVVNGRSLSTKSVRLVPNSVVTVRFDPVTVPATEAVALVALAPDPLPADDTLRMTLGAATGLPVVLLLPAGMPAGESLFLERALGISRSPALTVLVRRGAQLAAADLERASAVVVADVGTLAPTTVAALEPFVAKGRGLVAFAGRRGESLRPGGWLAVGLGRVIDRSTDRGGRLGQLDADHPAFEPFKAAISSDFGAARFFRYRDLLPDSNGVVLGRFDDGRPAIVERRLGAGRAVVMAFPADAVWSDLVLQPVFLPLVQRLVSHAAGLVESRRWFAVGDAAPLPSAAGTLTVETPNGDRQLAGPDSARTVTLTDPGLYRVTAPEQAAPVARFAVNPPAIESELVPVAAVDIGLLFRTGADSVAQAQNAELTVVEQERSQSWWVWLLAAALVLLALEAVYATRLQRGLGVTGGAR